MQNKSEDIISFVNETQNSEEQLKRALSTIVRLYKGRCHFIFELLQNAEDAGASKVLFIVNKDSLEFLHNGRPFTKQNFASLCDVANSDKISDEKIGKFGVGFKSVFTICDKVDVFNIPSNYSGICSEDMVLFGCTINNFTKPYLIKDPDFTSIDKQFTTKFVFNFAINSNNKDDYLGFSDFDSLRTTLIDEIKDINNTALLFLHNIKEIEYSSRIEDKKCSGRFKLDVLTEEKHQKYDFAHVVCYSGDRKLHFFKYSKTVYNKTVDIALSVKQHVGKDKTAYEIVPVKEQHISVYFPTGEISNTPFIVHGPYRTTPNREQIPFENGDVQNFELVKHTCELYEQVLLDLKSRNLLSLDTLNTLTIKDDSEENSVISQALCKASTEIFASNKLIPSIDGKYVTSDEGLIVDFDDSWWDSEDEKENFAIAKLLGKKYLTELLEQDKYFISTDIDNFEELHSFFTDYLNVNLFTKEEFIDALKNNPSFIENHKNDRWLDEFYSYLEIFVDFMSYYHSEWDNLLFLPFVKTTENQIITPFKKGIQNASHTSGGYSVGKNIFPNVYLPEDGIVDGVHFVDIVSAKKYEELFKEKLNLTPFGNQESFLIAFQKKYSSSEIKVSDSEYILDLRKLIGLIDESENLEPIKEAINKCFYIRCYSSDDKEKKPEFVNPQEKWIITKTTEEGIDSEKYFEEIETLFIADSGFYEKYEIKNEDLAKLEIHTNLVSECRYYTDGKSNHYNSNGFEPGLFFEDLEENIAYIGKHASEPLALMKSVAILNLLEFHKKKIHGIVVVGQEARKKMEMDCAALNYLKIGHSYDSSVSLHYSYKEYIHYPDWLFNSALKLCNPRDIQRNELHPLYNIEKNSKVYKLLGLKQTPAEQFRDKIDELAEQEHLSDSQMKNMLYEYMGIDIKAYNEYLEYKGSNVGFSPVSKSRHDIDFNDGTFEFPGETIKNAERYAQSASDKFNNAASVEYDVRPRRVRVSAINEEKRDYIKRKYQYQGHPDWYACQYCEQPTNIVECTQIEAYPAKELKEMHLCLCPECAKNYQELRNNEIKLRLFFKNILNTDVNKEETVLVPLDDDNGESIRFRATHFLEVKELLKQIDLAERSKTTEQKNQENNVASVTEMIVEHSKPDISQKLPISKIVINSEGPKTIAEIASEVNGVFPFFVAFSPADKSFYKVTGMNTDKSKYFCNRYLLDGTLQAENNFLSAASRKFYRCMPQLIVKK